MTKLKIDIQSGLLEVEGEEEFVKQIYADFKEKLVNILPIKQSPKALSSIADETKKPQVHKQKRKKVKQKGGAKRKESYNTVGDLELSSKNNKQSLKDFYKIKSPSSALENNAVFVYYLQKIAKIKNINVNHIYTCYKDVSKKVPGALRQSLADTAHNKGWINTSSMDDIKITTLGENFIEHDLPKPKEGK